MVELGWAWAIPLAWRMDGAWRVLRSEVPHVKRPPSEYLRDHFWYTTQPMLQPARDRWLVDVVEQFDRLGFGDKLLYSSDYPHWDFDAPEEALPPAVPHATRRRVLAGNASALYGIPL
jgi:predicted TIM-barrel fold metal-dependent hydrolase